MELNPKHPTVVGMRDNWHKIVAFLMYKFNVQSVEITMEDMRGWENNKLRNIAASSEGNILTLTLVDDETAQKLLHEEEKRGPS